MIKYYYKYIHLYKDKYKEALEFIQQYLFSSYYVFTIQKFIGNNPRLFKYDQAPMLGEILFDSDFESGNLDFVFKLENTSIYYCFMRMDTNTKGHT